MLGLYTLKGQILEILYPIQTMTIGEIFEEYKTKWTDSFFTRNDLSKRVADLFNDKYLKRGKKRYVCEHSGKLCYFYYLTKKGIRLLEKIVDNSYASVEDNEDIKEEAKKIDDKFEKTLYELKQDLGELEKCCCLEYPDAVIDYQEETVDPNYKKDEIVGNLVVRESSIDIIRKFRDVIPAFEYVLGIVCNDAEIELSELHDALKDFG